MTLGARPFAGVADAYQRYRVPYPAEVFDWIAREYSLDGRGRLLDIGCGTGYVCVPLSPWFEDVIAIDPEPDMLRVAAHTAHERGIANVRFLRLSAEDVPPSFAPLRLVTFGNSFHWTDRIKVATALFPLIARRGGLVALASSSAVAGDEPWKTAVLETLTAWVGADVARRVRAGRLADAPGHEDVLRETPFGEARVVNVVTRHTWTLDTLLGLFHSSSLQLRDTLQDRTEEFEQALRDRLTRMAPNGRFDDDIQFTIVSAKKT